MEKHDLKNTDVVGWTFLKVKNKSSLSHVRTILKNAPYSHCFLSDLTDNRGCCVRLNKDFLKQKLLLQASPEEVFTLVQSNKEHLRYIGEYGKATALIHPKAYQQLTLFFDKLDRDFVFEPAISPKSKPIRLPGGSMAGLEGFLEYRGIGGYRLYFKVLDICIISIRIDKKELAVTEKIPVPSEHPLPHWYVLLCRRELEYYDLLTKRGYKVYIPLQKKEPESTAEERVLVMRGYVFVHISPDCFRQLFLDLPSASDHLLFNRSETLRTPLIVPDKQLEDFIFLTESSSPQVTFAEEVYNVGDTVCLRKEGFEGIEGKLLRNGDQYQVFTSLANSQSGYLIKVEKGEFSKI